MEETQLKPGDIVKLKSGGPVMTFIDWYDGKTCTCGYFFNSEYKTIRVTQHALLLASM